MHTKGTHKIQVQRESNITEEEREVAKAIHNQHNNKHNLALGS